MKRVNYLLVAVIAGICFMVATPKTQAQVNINIGTAPECPYGYYDVAPYNCAPYGYYGPEWFTGGVLLALALGFMALNTFMATLTITIIPNTATRDRCRNAEKLVRRNTLPQRPRTSREMKFETDVDTR